MNSPVINWRKTKQLNKHLNKKGKLLVWTKIYAAPSGFEHEAPYIVALVDFGKEKATYQLVDFEVENLRGIAGSVVEVVLSAGMPVGFRKMVSQQNSPA